MAPHTRLDPAIIRQQIELLRATNPELWDEGEEALLADMLEAETGINEALTIIVDRMDDAEEIAIGADAIMTSKKARRDRYWARYDAMRTFAYKLMDMANIKKLTIPAATLSIRAGTPKVIITDEAALPEDCIRIKREPDKITIKQRLTEGIAVPGAELSNAEPVLAVKVK